MDYIFKIALLSTVMLIFANPAIEGQNGRAWSKEPDAVINDTERSLKDYFIQATPAPISPNEEGFIQRWLLLEPIEKPIRSNTLFTDSYLHHAFDSLYFQNQFTLLPKNGQKTRVGGKRLTWHALDSKLYNVKLFRFAYGLNKPVYGVLFWAVTTINTQEELRNVRLSVGSNSASKWWINGEEVLLLSGDRRMVMDNAVSRRLTLKKGKNIIRGAIINGPGMSDFCIRFLDENGEPVKNFKISYE